MFNNKEDKLHLLKKEILLSQEPIIKKYPTEVFAYAFSNRSTEAISALENQYCRYLNNTCNKPRKSEPSTKVGICSVGYKGSFLTNYKPIIICPNRFLEPIVFQKIKENYLSAWGDNLLWVSEVGMGVGGSVDYVAIKRDARNGQVDDFLCVEFQAAGTTGTPWPAVLDLKEYNQYMKDSYDYGINWANEFMKTMMQQVYKKGKIINFWRRKIIFVVQDVAIDYLHNAVDSSALRESQESDEIHFMTFKMEWNQTKWNLNYNNTVSTNIEGINRILGGAHENNYPTEDTFKYNIYSKGSKDALF